MEKLRQVNALDEKNLYEGKWLRMKQTTIEVPKDDGHFEKVNWEWVERTTRSSSGVDGVDVVAIIAKIFNEGESPSTIVVFQHRPATGKICIEFPAGLIDQGETVEEAAVRELKEETGLKGTVHTSCETMFLDPALSNENGKIVTVLVDGESIDNCKQELDKEECIITRKVPIKDLFKFLEDHQKKGFVVDARLFAWAHGFHMASELFGLGEYKGIMYYCSSSLPLQLSSDWSPSAVSSGAITDRRYILDFSNIFISALLLFFISSELAFPAQTLSRFFWSCLMSAISLFRVLTILSLMLISRHDSVVFSEGVFETGENSGESAFNLTLSVVDDAIVLSLLSILPTFSCSRIRADWRLASSPCILAISASLA